MDLSPVPGHEAAKECWRQTIGELFSFAEFGQTAFPRDLYNPERYLCVDIEVLLAFIFSVVPDTRDELSNNEAPGSVFDGSVVELADDGAYLKAHIQGTHRRYLTYEDCDGLVRGFPPWYRHTIKLNYPDANLTLKHPCFKNPRKCARGGWVIAVALTDVVPVPAYLDSPNIVEGQGRGKVLRAGCERVRVVLKRLKEMQSQPSNLAHAITEITRLLELGPSMGTYVPMPDISGMSSDNWYRLARTAIEIFDTKPADRLSADAILALETNGDLIVYWASRGAYKVLDYWKNPGREVVWDERLTPGRRIYVEDCRLPLM